MKQETITIKRTDIEHRQDISDANKQHFSDFLPLCTEASEQKFRSWLPYVLTRTEDILHLSLNDKKALIRLFSELKKQLKPSAYKTIYDVTKTFCRELNDRTVPPNFALLPKITRQDKATMQRVNNPEYKTFSWEEVKQIADTTTSIQMKAMLMLMIEAGLRPAELERLNYGDVERDGKFLIVHIWKSKTGKVRHPVLYRSAPAVNRWLQMHPFKKAKSPLWVMEQKEASSTFRNGDADLRYKYHAIKQAIRRMAKKAGHDKGLSLYMMRHSAISLAKQQGMDVDTGSDFFGNSIVHFTETYGKLSDEQKINRIKALHGEVKTQKDKPKPLLCAVCETINDPGVQICEKCSSPLTLNRALSEKEKLKQEMKAEMEVMKKEIIKTIAQKYR